MEEEKEEEEVKFGDVEHPKTAERLVSVGSMEVVASEDDDDDESEVDEDIWTTQVGQIKFALTSDIEGQSTSSSPSPSSAAAMRARVLEGRSFRKRRRNKKLVNEKELSEEVRRMSMGKRLTHFQALSLLHKVMAYSQTSVDKNEDHEDEMAEEEQTEIEKEVVDAAESDDDDSAKQGPSKVVKEVVEEEIFAVKVHKCGGEGTSTNQ